MKGNEAVGLGLGKFKEWNIRDGRNIELIRA
jgi:hypothetical protein